MFFFCFLSLHLLFKGCCFLFFVVFCFLLFFLWMRIHEMMMMMGEEKKEVRGWWGLIALECISSVFISSIPNPSLPPSDSVDGLNVSHSLNPKTLKSLFHASKCLIWSSLSITTPAGLLRLDVSTLCSVIFFLYCPRQSLLYHPIPLFSFKDLKNSKSKSKSKSSSALFSFWGTQSRDHRFDLTTSNRTRTSWSDS